MKTRFLSLGAVLLLLSACSKTIDKIAETVVETPAINAPPPATKSFTQYNILQGQQYCDKNGYLAVNYDSLAFQVKFDSSAIYQTVSPSNQNDVNKLYGFSDNNATHHQFSARFGWRWSNNALRLFAYTYNNSVLDIKELGTVQIGAVNDCGIKVSGENYVFTLNGKKMSVSRASTTPLGTGYQLYPYFGGTETAPHNISIWIKQL